MEFNQNTKVSTPAVWLSWRYACVGVLLVALQVLVLHLLGQPLISKTGVIALWAGDPLGPENSQQIFDWYSFSHIIHGFLFYWILTKAAPRLSVPARLLIAVGVEVGWEMFENTQFIINAYRHQALAVGYSGDSIINSLSDTLMMTTGFILAWRFPVKLIVALAIVMELVSGYMIRDNFTLNALNFIAPLQVVHTWQAGL